MTITQISSRKIIDGSGWVNPLTHTYMVENASYVHVFADAVELVNGVDYTVGGVGNVAGYSVTIAVPGSWAPTVWVLDARPPIAQGKSLAVGGTFGVKYEDGLDQLARRLQRVYDMSLRAVKIALTSDEDGEFKFPAPGAGLSIGWNDAGTALENRAGISSADLLDFAADAQAAADAAVSAAASLNQISALLDGYSALSIGTVTTLTAGLPATVTNVGTPGEVVLDFGIPRGETGAAGAGTGDVIGPAAATNNGFVRFDSTTGKLLKDSAAIVTVADGGTGSATPAAARTALGLAIGTDVQAYDAQLSSLIRQNSKSAAYTLVLTDGGKHIYHPAADTTARVWTIPANASVAFPIGTAITFDNDFGAGAVTVAIATDVLVMVGEAGGTGSRTLASGGQATAIKVTATRWRISGVGLT